MSYTLPPDLQSLLQKHLTLGKYTNEEDVLRDALLALEDRQAILEDIRIGIDDLQAGRGTPLEDIDAQLREKHNIPRPS